MTLLTILCYDTVFRSLVMSSSDRRPRAPPPLDCVAHGCNHTVVFGLHFDRREFEDYRRQENCLMDERRRQRQIATEDQ